MKRFFFTLLLALSSIQVNSATIDFECTFQYTIESCDAICSKSDPNNICGRVSFFNNPPRCNVSCLNCCSCPAGYAAFYPSPTFYPSTAHVLPNFYPSPAHAPGICPTCYCISCDCAAQCQDKGKGTTVTLPNGCSPRSCRC